MKPLHESIHSMFQWPGVFSKCKQLSIPVIVKCPAPMHLFHSSLKQIPETRVFIRGFRSRSPLFACPPVKPKKLQTSLALGFHIGTTPKSSGVSAAGAAKAPASQARREALRAQDLESDLAHLNRSSTWY